MLSFYLPYLLNLFCMNVHLQRQILVPFLLSADIYLSCYQLNFFYILQSEQNVRKSLKLSKDLFFLLVKLLIYPWLIFSFFPPLTWWSIPRMFNRLNLLRIGSQQRYFWGDQVSKLRFIKHRRWLLQRNSLESYRWVFTLVYIILSNVGVVNSLFQSLILKDSVEKWIKKGMLTLILFAWTRKIVNDSSQSISY